MNNNSAALDTSETPKSNLKIYVLGFILSIVLTLASFLLVMKQLLSPSILVYVLIGLALTQTVIQLIFFLNLGQEPKPRFKTGIFFFMALVVLIVVLGSIWIIFDLDNRVMPTMNSTEQKV